MIRLELPELIAVYLLLFLAAIFAVRIAYEIARRIRDQHSLRFRVKCTICGMEFEDRGSTVLPRCPGCGSLNERFKLRAY